MHDSHIHLALEPLKSNVDTIIKEFIDSGGKYILSQGTDIKDFEETLKISKKYPNIVHVALGLHPTFFEEKSIHKNQYRDITKRSLKYIEEFENIIKENIHRITAVGETGLDYYHLSLTKNIPKDIVEEIMQVQKKSFIRHLEIAKENNLPLSIHARDQQNINNCVSDTIQLVAKHGKGLLRGSFHSYTGNIKFVNDILDLGFHIGFNAIITYKSGENVREILKVTPLERILFETDGPFLPPQSIRKNKKIKEKFAKPSHVREIMQVAAEVKGVSIEDMEKISDQNYENLFLNR